MFPFRPGNLGLFGALLQPLAQKKKMRKFGKKTAKNSAIFNENFEIREQCKGVHCVDLGESFPTSIYLQNLASIQPRTSPVKFARSPRTDPPGQQFILQWMYIEALHVRTNALAADPRLPLRVSRPLTHSL